MKTRLHLGAALWAAAVLTLGSKQFQPGPNPASQPLANQTMPSPGWAYFEDFESGAIPPGWVEWNFLQYHPDTWGFTNLALGGASSAAFSDDYGLALGAFYSLPDAYNEIWLSFWFAHEGVDDFSGFEVCDLYDPAGNEICDTYLVGDYLILSIGGSRNALLLNPVPAGVPVKIWIHYRRGTVTSFGELAWSYTGDYPDCSVSQQYGYTSAPTYNSPCSEILLGPVFNGAVFIYDNLNLSADQTLGGGIGW